MKKRIYLDNNATTGLDPRVLQAMLEDLCETPGNPSSIHSYGQEARNRVTKARRSIATFLNVKPSELVFTSGGTEAINLAIRGAFGTHVRGHIVTSLTEHASVIDTVRAMVAHGCEATYLSPGLWGAVTPEAVKEAIRPDTRLIVLMAVNNETGVKTDIERIAQIAQEAKIPFVVDGVALLGKEQFKIPQGISAMCFSGHKIHAPKGIGLLYLSHSFKITPQITGGGQESGRRSGTENVSGILGIAEAFRILQEELPAASERMARLRERLEQGLMKRVLGIKVNGQGPRIVNTVNLAFEGVEGESLLMNLDLAGIAVSHGSACSSGALEPSRILLAMGTSREQAAASVRFSLSRWTTEEEIDTCIDVVSNNVKRKMMNDE